MRIIFEYQHHEEANTVEVALNISHALSKNAVSGSTIRRWFTRFRDSREKTQS